MKIFSIVKGTQNSSCCVFEYFILFSWENWEFSSSARRRIFHSFSPSQCRRHSEPTPRQHGTLFQFPFIPALCCSVCHSLSRARGAQFSINVFFFANIRRSEWFSILRAFSPSFSYFYSSFSCTETEFHIIFAQFRFGFSFSPGLKSHRPSSILSLIIRISNKIKLQSRRKWKIRRKFGKSFSVKSFERKLPKIDRVKVSKI